MHRQLRINKDRLQHQLDALSCIGALEGGGVCRLAFSDQDKAGRDYVETQMRELGLTVRIDRIGNIIGLRGGHGSGSAVLTGSHTDTVATGGRFDGGLGVLAGLEVVETLNEAGIRTRSPIAVASFVNEEGSRFMPDMMGSLVFRGDLTVEDARSIIGIDGTSVGENIDRTGYSGTDNFSDMQLRCYVELHIEQGPVLEEDSQKIGVVEAVQGIKWIEFMLRGSTAHAGATPMALRHDAGYVAGAAVNYVRQLSSEVAGQRATVGSLTLAPNIVNVVAEKARFTVDLRNPDAVRLRHAEERLLQFVRETAEAEGVSVRHETRVDVPPVVFDPQTVEAVEAAVLQLGYPGKRIFSGAGHDAQILAAMCPTAMIFVPSRGGISHNIHEYTNPEEIEAGANVLLHTLLAIAEVS